MLEKSKVLTNKLDAFCEHEYSKVIFDIFSKIAPKIVKMNYAKSSSYNTIKMIYAEKLKDVSD